MSGGVRVEGSREAVCVCVCGVCVCVWGGGGGGARACSRGRGRGTGSHHGQLAEIEAGRWLDSFLSQPHTTYPCRAAAVYSTDPPGQRLGVYMKGVPLSAPVHAE